MCAVYDVVDINGYDLDVTSGGEPLECLGEHSSHIWFQILAVSWAHAQFDLGRFGDALLSPFVFPALIDAVSTHHPQVQLELREDLSHVVQHELLIGKLDLAFVNRRHLEPGITGQLVQPAEPYVMVPLGTSWKRSLR